MKITFIDLDGNFKTYKIGLGNVKNEKFKFVYYNWANYSQYLEVIFENMGEMEKSPTYVLKNASSVLYRDGDDKLIIIKDRFNNYDTNFSKNEINNDEDIDKLYKECKDIKFSLSEKLTMAKDKINELQNSNRSNHLFLKYLYNYLPSNMKSLIETYCDCSYANVIGYVENVKKEVDYNNNLILVFETDDHSYRAKWVNNYGYACYQTNSCCEDDYYGYLLFPTDNVDRYLLIAFSC